MLKQTIIDLNLSQTEAKDKLEEKEKEVQEAKDKLEQKDREVQEANDKFEEKDKEMDRLIS